MGEGTCPPKGTFSFSIFILCVHTLNLLFSHYEIIILLHAQFELSQTLWLFGYSLRTVYWEKIVFS